MIKNFEPLRGFLLTLVLFVVGIKADGAMQYLIVSLNDGTQASFALSDDPIVGVADNTLTVETSAQRISVSFSDLKCYSFSECTSSVDAIASDKSSHSIEGDYIYFSGLKQGDKVSAYSISGQLMQSTVADTQGNATIEMLQFPTGVYVITYSSTSFKIIKK